MGKKKNEERFQPKTPGSGEKEGKPAKSQPGARETKERENESVTKLTLLKSPVDKKQTPVNTEELGDHSCYEDDWSSEDDIPESWEETEAAMHQTRRKASNEQTGKKHSESQQSKVKKASEEISIQQESRNGLQNKQEDEVNEQDIPTVETTNLGATLKKMSKIDRSFMKTLLTLAAGTEDKETLLDKLLTEFTKLKSLTLEATHEVARLQGVTASTQEKNAETPTYAAVVKGQNHSQEINNEIRDYFDQENKEKSIKSKLALIITSDQLDKEQMQSIMKRKVDPHELGVLEAEMRPARDGIVVMASSKKGLQRLEDFITNDAELASKLKTKHPKEKNLAIKVIGIDEELSNDEIGKKIIQQNNLPCSTKEVKVNKTWRGKYGKTAIISLSLQAFEALKGRTHLTIGWDRCPMYDNTFVPRCTFCAKYGHTQRWCQARVAKCTECGGGHHFKECRKNDYECCACTEEGLDPEQASHSMMSVNCPTFQKRKEQERDKIIRYLQLAGV
ncbi:hypothetical protein HPB49_015636 [Dermacentor silvarum]|uniref:Uncharacterized protein n=1 Tax=Dermacentor silvarum TaxID=543639 RepID=A0ACB8CY29_DERSI|nr:hypothetical protein HPB49_015636 [Dermacentor silvarum]